MKSKKYWTVVLVAAACLLAVAVYQARKPAGENAAESGSRETEPAFQEEKDDYLAANPAEQAIEDDDDHAAVEAKEQAAEEQDDYVAADMKEPAAEKKDDYLAAEPKEQAAEEKDEHLAAKPGESAAEEKDDYVAAKPNEPAAEEKEDYLAADSKEQATEEKGNDLAAEPTEDPPVSPPATKASQKGLITGIAYSADSASAVIDNRIVHEGEAINGVTVVNIRKDRVVFEKEGKQAILRWTQKIGETPRAYWE